MAEVDHTIVVIRQVAASPMGVFASLTRPEELLEWWGHKERWWLTAANVDLRVGGRFHFDWLNTQGTSGSMHGVYLAIEAPQRLCSTWVGTHEKSHAEELEFLLEPEGRGTRLEIRHSGLQGRPEARADYQRGWELISDWLCEYHANHHGRRGPFAA
ncbi:MAG TPA: SRPBCC domain-containing protein [Terriglobales bacterium]|nr:SRPBCC domain-containing protein [Terriglobales bacterium]